MLVNNAGIMPVGRIVDEDDSVTRRIIEIDVLGVITGTKLALRRMLPRGRGHVINIASLAGELPCPGLSTYCGAKHAVLGFTDSVRKEVRATGVHISSVLPTLTNTQLTSGTSGMKGFREVQPEEIAEAIVGLITKPRPRVRITRVSGLLVQAQGFFPRRPYEALSDCSASRRSFSATSTPRHVLPTKNAPAQADQVSSVAGQSSSFAPSTAAWSAKLSLGSLTF